MYRFIYYCAFKYNFKLERTDLLNWTEVLCTNAPSNALLCYAQPVQILPHTRADAVLYKVERDVSFAICSLLTV